MAGQQAFHHGCQQFHFGRRLGAGQHPFRFDQTLRGKRVFMNQSFSNSCHIYDGWLNRKLFFRSWLLGALIETAIEKTEFRRHATLAPAEEASG